MNDPPPRRATTTALQTWGYDPAAGERARAAEPRSLGLTIPPLSPKIMDLKIPKDEFGPAYLLDWASGFRARTARTPRGCQRAGRGSVGAMWDNDVQPGSG